MEHLLKLFVFTCTAAVASSSAATKPTCSAPPAYLGKRGSLTCYFSVDVTAEKISFNVRRADRHDFDYKRDTVLDCDWIEGEQLCLTIKDDFIYDYHVSNRLTMIIPNVTLEHQGLYTCQVFKEATNNIQSCSLTVSKLESSPRASDDVIFGTTQTTLTTTLEMPLEEKQVQTADLNIAAIVVPVVIGAVLVVAILIVVYVFKRRNGQKINRAATTPAEDDDSCTHNQERQPLTGDPCVTSPASTTWDENEEEAPDKDRANGDDATEENGDENGSEHRADDGDKRNNDANEYSKPGMSRDDKGMEDEEGPGARQKGLKGRGAIRKTLKKKFNLVVKQLKQKNEKGVYNLREVPDKRKSAWQDQKEKVNTTNPQDPDQTLTQIHELQETYNESEHRDDNGDERNTEENEPSKPGTSRDDKGKEDEEGPGCTEKGPKKGPGALKKTLKKKFDLVVKQMKQNMGKGMDNLREVPDKRMSACRDPTEKVNTTNRRDPDQTLTQIHELQESCNESEHRDDDGDERNTEENEHSKSGTSRDDKGKEDGEGPDAWKIALKGMFDLVVKQLDRINEKGEDNLREVPNKRKSAWRGPKEKVNTTNPQEPEEKLNVIHEEN